MRASEDISISTIDTVSGIYIYRVDDLNAIYIYMEFGIIFLDQNDFECCISYASNATYHRALISYECRINRKMDSSLKEKIDFCRMDYFLNTPLNVRADNLKHCLKQNKKNR